MRALLRGVREKYGWSDLPYHYLVDRDGRVFVGRPERYAGDTHTEYDPGDALHIALLGNYSKLEPTAAQMDAVIALVVMKADQYNLTPSAIFLHGDLADTECPGSQRAPPFQSPRLGPSPGPVEDIAVPPLATPVISVAGERARFSDVRSFSTSRG